MLIIHHHKPECLVKNLNYCIQGQGHREGQHVHVYPDDIVLVLCFAGLRGWVVSRVRQYNVCLNILVSVLSVCRDRKEASEGGGGTLKEQRNRGQGGGGTAAPTGPLAKQP